MVNPDRNLYEPPYDDALLYDGDLEPERPRSRPLVVLLGIVVLAAFAGVVWVAYNQGVRQGQDGLPVLIADKGPTRIVPDQTTIGQSNNPAPDKSYERLWGETPEGDGQVQVLPQAEQPRTIPAPQDVATGTVAPEPDRSVGGPFGTKATDVAPPSGDPRMDTTTGAVSSAAKGATTDSPRSIAAAPPALFGPKPQTEDITSELPPVEIVTQPVVGAPAPKPVAPKPVTIAKTAPPSAIKSAPPVVEPVQPSAEVNPALLSPPVESAPPAEPKSSAGRSFMVQLGSFPNDGLAATAWSKAKSSNSELLDGYSPNIVPAQIDGKGTWYRLRVGGFPDRASAISICEQLKAGGQACIVTGK